VRSASGGFPLFDPRQRVIEELTGGLKFGLVLAEQPAGSARQILGVPLNLDGRDLNVHFKLAVVHFVSPERLLAAPALWVGDFIAEPNRRWSVFRFA
jgi:hypothetical protein